MLNEVPGRHRITVGADRTYDTADFIAEMRAMKGDPHEPGHCIAVLIVWPGATTRPEIDRELPISHTGTGRSDQTRYFSEACRRHNCVKGHELCLNGDEPSHRSGHSPFVVNERERRRKFL
jgi:hypothetical protein